MRDVKVFTLNDMTFLEYNDVTEKWPSTFSRVFEKAKSYCCGALYPYEVGSLGAFRCLVRNKSLAASGKEPCHFEGWYANREIKLFQWRQKTFGIVSIQVNPWIVPQQHIGGFQYVSRWVLYGVYGSRRYQKFIEYTFLILIQGNSVADKRPRHNTAVHLFPLVQCLLAKKNLNKFRLWGDLILTWLKNSHSALSDSKWKDD